MRLWIVIWIGLLSAGCTSEWVRADARQRSAASVAVLPFVPAGDLPDEPQSRHYAGLMETILTGHLASGPYVCLAPEIVRERLASAGLQGAKSPRDSSLERLREVLGVDLVVRGELIEDLHVQAGLVYWRSVGCRIEVTDLRDGARFALIESLEVDFGGLLMEMGQPAEGIEDSIDSHNELAFVRLAEFLAQGLLRYLPDPERAPLVEAPRIDSVEVQVERGPVPSRARVGPQSTILVSLVGAPGGRASLRLSGGRAVPLVEREPGRYCGRYRVQRGDHCQAPWVLLSGPLGASSARPLDLSFDIRPPRPPQGLQAELRGEELRLSWSPPWRSEVTLGRFVVYAQGREGEVVEITRSGETEVFLVARPEVDRYRVAVLSRAGVLGQSASIVAPQQLAPELLTPEEGQ